MRQNQIKIMRELFRVMHHMQELEQQIHSGDNACKTLLYRRVTNKPLVC